MILISGGTVLAADAVLKRGDVLVDGRKIVRIAERIPRKGAEVVDARGSLVSPGLIDTQINGGFGITFSQATPAEIAEVGAKLLRHGVTAYLPTLVSLPRETTLEAIARIREAAAAGGGARILGIHLEGPYLSREKRGAHSDAHVRAPSQEEFRSFREAAGGLLRMMTIAPELPGALDVVREGAKAGIVMAAGHSMATAEDVSRAFLEGLRHVTHVFNAMAPLHHREETILNAALILDGLSCGMIYDRHHLSLGTALLLLRAKPPGSLVLVSDATAALEAPDGTYRIDGTSFVVEKGTIRVEGSGRLGGSAASILEGVRNLVADAGLPAALAIHMASGAAARVLGLRKKGSLHAGADADLVLFDRALAVRRTMVEGRWRS
jgi:N-acetylglucosamine-6-phosphate deacetylase